MSELNDAALKLLYDEELFIIKEKGYSKPHEEPILNEVFEPAPEPISFEFKGENKKGIAILFQNENDTSLDPADETLLLNILKAVGLSMEDVAIINHSVGVDWKDKVKISKVLVFGISQEAYNHTGELYSIAEKEGRSWLFAHSLTELANDKVLKGKLWKSLQSLFI